MPPAPAWPHMPDSPSTRNRSSSGVSTTVSLNEHAAGDRTPGKAGGAPGPTRGGDTSWRWSAARAAQDARGAPRGVKRLGTRGVGRKASGSGGKCASRSAARNAYAANAQRGVMVEAPPAPPFEVIQPQLVLQLLVVPLDPPAQHGEPDQIGARGHRRQRGQPILDRGGFGARPLDEQPLFGARRRTPVVAMRGPHADRREARAHRAPRALAPGHGAPGPRRELLGQGPYAEWPMPPRATNQRRRPAVASILRGWQRCAAGRPDSRLGADAHDVRNGPGGQR